MVGEVAVRELIFHAGGVRAVPAVASHDCALKSGVPRRSHEKRNGIQEAGIEQEVRPVRHHLGGLGGIVRIGCGALAHVDDLNAVGLSVLNKGIL